MAERARGAGAAGRRAPGGESLLERYLAYLGSVRGLADNTITAYRKDLTAYLEFVRSEGVDEDDPRAVRTFLGDLGRRRLAPATINRMISGLRGYFRFKRRFGLADDSPLDGVRGRKTARRLPSFLFVEEVDRLLPREIRPGGFREARDRALLEFLYCTGCRAAEAASADIRDIDLRGRQVRVLGKGRRERIVFLGELAIEALKEYLLVRQRRGAGRGSRSEALFVNVRGDRLTTRGLRYIIRRYVNESSWEKPVTAHTFRHSFATHVLDGGADIRVVQELLGHANLSTTQVYTHVGLEKLRRVYRRAHPHARGERSNGALAKHDGDSGPQKREARDGRGRSGDDGPDRGQG